MAKSVELQQVGRCGDCRWWDLTKPRYEPPNEPFEYGYCYRFPPVPTGNVYGHSAHPQTEGADWCGEFQPATVAPPADPTSPA